jgi:hypothetical protein
MSKQLDRIRKNARANLYLVSTSTGYWAAYNAESCSQIILSEDETEAKILFQEMVNPLKENLPYRKSLADELIDRAEGKVKPEPKQREMMRQGRILSLLTNRNTK